MSVKYYTLHKYCTSTTQVLRKYASTTQVLHGSCKDTRHCLSAAWVPGTTQVLHGSCKDTRHCLSAAWLPGCYTSTARILQGYHTLLVCGLVTTQVLHKYYTDPARIPDTACLLEQVLGESAAFFKRNQHPSALRCRDLSSVTRPPGWHRQPAAWQTP